MLRRPATLLLLLLLAAALPPPTSTTAATRPPINVAIILADDLGTFDLSVMGHPSIRTPCLDQLAKEGALFTQWLSAAPICTPSRSVR